MKTKLTYGQIELIKANSNMVYDGINRWYHIPFYYKESEDGITEQFFYHELPEYVKNYLEELKKR